MQRLAATLIILCVKPSRAGHCYSNPDCATCVSDSRGSACEWCSGSCQMAWDACSAPATTLASCPDYTYTPPPGDDFFEDVTSLLTTNPTQRNYGVAVTDTNGNGKFEFVVAGYGAANQAFEWDGTAYVDVALGSSVLQDASSSAIGVAACDVDGDGAEELYVLNTDQYSGTTSTSDRLVKRDTASGAHIELFALAENQNSANYVAGRSCACVDRTGDGTYGVMVANYGGPMRLFEAEADGRTITDVAPAAGVDFTTGGRALVAGPIVTEHMDILANNEGYGYGRRLAANADTAASGYADAEVEARESGTVREVMGAAPGEEEEEEETVEEEKEGEDERGQRRRLSHRANFFFVNNGDGTFSDRASEVGLLDNYYTGRGTALFDANGDGLVDVVYGNWNGPHRLFVQSRDEGGSASFTDVAPDAMAAASPIRTVIVADFDNDGCVRAAAPPHGRTGRLHLLHLPSSLPPHPIRSTPPRPTLTRAPPPTAPSPHRPTAPPAHDPNCSRPANPCAAVTRRSSGTTSRARTASSEGSRPTPTGRRSTPAPPSTPPATAPAPPSATLTATAPSSCSCRMESQRHSHSLCTDRCWGKATPT